MKLIPPRFPDDVRNSGEAAVFHELNINSGHPLMTAYHSLVVTEHAYKILGEADFILADPRHLIVLEVKGGQISCDANGVWHYPYESKRESPFRQAQDAMFALRKRLLQEFGQGFVDRITFGFGVILTETELHGRRFLECPVEALIDATAMRNDPGLSRFLKGLLRYWDLKPGADRKSGLDEVEFKRLKGFLKPVFEALPSLRAQTDSVERQIATLTTEQFRILDMAKKLPRLICTGGAGTGKTFLAMELARRQAFMGRKVLVTCRNPILADYLRRECSLPGVHILDLDSLRAATRPQEEEKYQHLIIDEGQDLLTFGTLGILEPLLEGGFEHGSWALFLDPFNQAGVDGEFEYEAMAFMEGMTPPLCLDKNCRNTQSILTSIKVSTGLDLESSTIAGGPDVVFRKYVDEAEGAHHLGESIETMLRNDVTAEDISILSSVPMDESLARLLPGDIRSRVRVLSRDGHRCPARGFISFATIQDFKGLESRYIYLVDLRPEMLSTEGRNFVYVGMSRSRTWLWIGMNPEFRKALENAQVSNALKRA